ncbi:MAG: aminoacyl-tRNA hydrolase [Lactobacillales bacterium]|jgi:PTH1 family peptidyl-tRNA hydrolase|nr:aminoacyl-tRNA hydrolase [Lactobacillales bacterium]
MKVIVGLGNPGAKYAKTKHNVGWMALDEIAYRLGWQFDQNEFSADIATGHINGEKVMLVKPLTFMNLSGNSVGPLMTFYQVYDEELIVLHDDLDSPLGRVRLRAKGSAGGQNGMKSIIAALGTNEIQRCKIGIGRPIHKGQAVTSHVLSPFETQDFDAMHDALHKAADATLDWVETGDFLATMNKFN